MRSVSPEGVGISITPLTGLVQGITGLSRLIWNWEYEGKATKKTISAAKTVESVSCN